MLNQSSVKNQINHENKTTVYEYQGRYTEAEPLLIRAKLLRI